MVRGAASERKERNQNLTIQGSHPDLGSFLNVKAALNLALLLQTNLQPRHFFLDLWSYDVLVS